MTTIGERCDPLPPPGLDGLLAALAETERIAALSNRRLVVEVCDTVGEASLLLTEMMTRLDPDWAKESRPGEQENVCPT